MAIIRFDWAPPTRVLRTFGVSLIATGLVIGAVLYWNDLPTAAGIVAGVLGVLGLVPLAAPTSAVGLLVYRVVSLPGFAIGNVVSVVFVAVVYWLLVTPIGLVRRLRRDPLAVARHDGTYWSEVDPVGLNRDPERPF